jgi:hypothetical protein
MDGLERSSLDIATREPADSTTIMTASSAQPWRALPAIRPNVFVRANGMIRMSSISTQFEIVVGFSNGWAELALKKPPPLVPSSLMASCEATGPSGIVCTRPWRVWTVIELAKVWITPWETRTSAPTKAIGSRM